MNAAAVLPQADRQPATILMNCSLPQKQSILVLSWHPLSDSQVFKQPGSKSPGELDVGRAELVVGMKLELELELELELARWQKAP